MLFAFPVLLIPAPLRTEVFVGKAEGQFLKPNVVIEPLVDSWYAWAHLIPPATFARNLTERHLKIMDGFVAAPEQHQAAVANPKMLGGPFIDVNPDRVHDVRGLRDRTRNQRQPYVELSKAIADLDAMLRQNASGYSLESLYDLVPAPLQGYVELVYDLNNHPSFRLFESLLYTSQYYDPSLQSFALSTISGDDRPFVLSTPRLESDDAVRLQIPFSSSAMDHLFASKRQPVQLKKLKEMIEWPDQYDSVMANFFTHTQPKPYAPYDGPGARWRYFGHACILIESGGKSILLDPVLSYTYDNQISRYTYEDLPEHIDFVLITHNHQDHILFETLLQLRHRIGTVVVPANGGGALQDPSLKLILKQCGFKSVLELAEMEEIADEQLSITAVPFLGEHGDLNVRSKTAYLVRVENHSLFFGADSCNISPALYEHIHRTVGDVDALFLGMECDGAPASWIYGPLFTQKLERAKDQSRRLAGSDFARAIRIVEQFHCSEVYVYAMGQEPWLNYVMSIKYTEQSNPIIQSNRLIQVCKERGIISERLFGEKEILLQPKRRSAVAV